MEKNMKQIISEELEQFHCSILLEEVKEKIRKLKAYGVEDDRIVAVMNEEELFPQVDNNRGIQDNAIRRQSHRGGNGTTCESCISVISFSS